MPQKLQISWAKISLRSWDSSIHASIHVYDGSRSRTHAAGFGTRQGNFLSLAEFFFLSLNLDGTPHEFLFALEGGAESDSGIDALVALAIALAAMTPIFGLFAPIWVGGNPLAIIFLSSSNLGVEGRILAFHRRRFGGCSTG